jgi:hypothetical protein
MLHYLPSIRWSALLLALQQSDGIGGVLRETFRSGRTPPDPLHLPDRRSLESRKPDNQIPYALVLLNELATLAPLAVHNGWIGKTFREVVLRTTPVVFNPARSP